MEWEEILAKEATDKDLISKIHKQLIWLNIKKPPNQKMGRKPKQTFFQRRHRNSQKAHEKMVNNANQQKNVNQNCKEIPPPTSKNGHHLSLQTNAGEAVEEREPSYTVGGNANWYSHYGEQYGVSLKKKLHTDLDIIQQSHSWAYISRENHNLRRCTHPSVH